jgi:hypothetical protein
MPLRMTEGHAAEHKQRQATQSTLLNAQRTQREGLRDGWGREAVAAALIGRAKGKNFWSKEAAYRWLNRLAKKHPNWKRSTDEFGVEYNVRAILSVKLKQRPPA